MTFTEDVRARVESVLPSLRVFVKLSGEEDINNFAVELFAENGWLTELAVTYDQDEGYVRAQVGKQTRIALGLTATTTHRRGDGFTYTVLS